MLAFAAGAVEVVVEGDVDLGEDCDPDERPATGNLRPFYLNFVRLVTRWPQSRD
jgi:hypothetical protein